MTLEVRQMIFHVVGKEDGPTLFDEVVVPEQHRGTFRQLISSAARGKKFNWEATAGMPEYLSRISAEGSALDFVVASKTLATEFDGRHRGNMSAGVLLFADIAINGQPMFLLNKYDEMNVLQFEVNEKNGQRVARIQGVEHTIVEDDKALQKSILFLGTSISDSIFIYDRTNRNVAEFVRTWLSVRAHFTDETATEAIYKALGVTMARPNVPATAASQKSWRQNFFDLVDRKEDVDLSTDAGRNTFLSRVFPEDAQNKNLIDMMIEGFQKSFVADESATLARGKLQRPRRRQFRTSEGIVVRFSPEDREAGRVRREPDADGNTIITVISTGTVVENDVE